VKSTFGAFLTLPLDIFIKDDDLDTLRKMPRISSEPLKWGTLVLQLQPSLVWFAFIDYIGVSVIGSGWKA